MLGLARRQGCDTTRQAPRSHARHSTKLEFERQAAIECNPECRRGTQADVSGQELSGPLMARKRCYARKMIQNLGRDEVDFRLPVQRSFTHPSWRSNSAGRS